MTATDNKPIVLALNQSAEAGHCGTCKFFVRRDGGKGVDFSRDLGMYDGDKQGHCKFRFPPNRIYAKQSWDGDSPPMDTVHDTDACDLWQSDGRRYMISRVVP